MSLLRWMFCINHKKKKEENFRLAEFSLKRLMGLKNEIHPYNVRLLFFTSFVFLSLNKSIS